MDKESGQKERKAEQRGCVKMNRIRRIFLSLIFLISICLYGCDGQIFNQDALTTANDSAGVTNKKNITLEEIPEFSDAPYVELNGNQPAFQKSDYTTDAFEEYCTLDELGRCGAAYANICKEIMPTEKRSGIGSVKPSGWHTVKYDIVDGKYLYNRCHLIGYQLAGENANEKNLITGTRYMNVQGMLPFEDLVDEYVEETNHHVLYRVTPVYDGDNLVAKGVQMEGWSVEDNGKGICFNVFVYNNQPGIEIDYATGDSWLSTDMAGKAKTEPQKEKEKTKKADTKKQSTEYILNTNTHKFHYPTCSNIDEIKEENKNVYYGSREELVEQGYEPCGNCKP